MAPQRQGDFVGTAKVYTLSDDNGIVFYVGCTVHSLEKRLLSHISEARSNSHFSNKKKNERIKSLNFSVVITIVDMMEVTGKKASWAAGQARSLEHEWIMKFHSLGYDLCNRIIDKQKVINSKKDVPAFIGQTLKSKKLGEKSLQIMEVPIEPGGKENTISPQVQ